MNKNFFTKTIFLAVLSLIILNCQNNSNTATVDNKTINTNKINLNVNAANTNSNVAKSNETEIPAPQNVKFESAEKVEIIGTFYQSPKENSPAVLLLHQFGSNRKSYDEFAKTMQKEGFGVLAIDGRGFGESVKMADGKPFEFTPNPAAVSPKLVKDMETDVGNAFDFLAKQKNVDPARIGIVGASYGSSLALIYAAKNPKVKAVALLSTGLNYFNNLPTEPAVKNYGDRPLLLVAAEDDKESAADSKKLKQMTTNEKYQIQIYPKGGHGTDIFAAKVGLQNFLKEFLKKSL